MIYDRMLVQQNRVHQHSSSKGDVSLRAGHQAAEHDAGSSAQLSVAVLLLWIYVTGVEIYTGRAVQALREEHPVPSISPALFW